MGLTAAVDAAARAVHHFDEVPAILVFVDDLHDILQILKGAVNDSNAKFENLAALSLQRNRHSSFN